MEQRPALGADAIADIRWRLHGNWRAPESRS